MEVSVFGIKVTIIEPGAAKTDFGSRSTDRGGTDGNVRWYPSRHGVQDVGQP